MSGPGGGRGRGRGRGRGGLVAIPQSSEDAGAVVPCDDEGKPIRRHTAGDRDEACRLLIDEGLSFRETVSVLPFVVSVSTLHEWYIRALASRPAPSGEAGTTSAGGSSGGSSSALDAAFAAKRRGLKLRYLLAADELLQSAVSLGLMGDGKGAQGCMMGSAIALDKAQLLDGKPTSAKYGRWDMVHTVGGVVETTPEGRQALIAAARSQEAASDMQLTQPNED